MLNKPLIVGELGVAPAEVGGVDAWAALARQPDDPVLRELAVER